MFTRNAPAYWEGELEQVESAPTGSFTHLPVTWSGVLAASFIRGGVQSFGTRLRVNPTADSDPASVTGVVPFDVVEPSVDKDQGDIDPLYELP